jgi:hypothetical protein
MRPTYATLALALACALALAGCRPGAGTAESRAPTRAEADEVLAEVNAFTAELMRKIETAPDPTEGLAEAQGRLDGRKEGLASKIAALKRSGALGEDEEARARLLESEVENVRNVSTLRTKYMREAMRDDSFRQRLDRFVGDYEALWRE